MATLESEPTFRMELEGGIGFATTGRKRDLERAAEEISEAAWFYPAEAASKAVSHFDVAALQSLI